VKVKNPMASPRLPHEADDLIRIWALASTVPAAVQGIFHEVLSRTVDNDPEAPAICAWDGQMTYSELDKLSTKLAYQLVNLGLGPGSIVPLYFEKSMWTVVSALSVVKTGAAFVMLDYALPEQRLEAIVRQTQSQIILTSFRNRDLSSQLSQSVVMIGPTLFIAEQQNLLCELPRPEPSAALYIVFTSGSTGTPKGVVVSHENLCSALHYQLPYLGFTAASRVFDFASYSFDVSVHNLFATLAVGGCLCIPNETARKNNIEVSMAAMGTTLVNLTPSVARLIKRAAVPSLETLIFLGEMVTESDSKDWWGKTRVINTYGPSECTPISTINLTATNAAMVPSIGKGMGLVTWIVDPEDHDLLSPFGCVGELLVEGPLVGRGYLHDPEKTAAAFIEDPPWLLRGAPDFPGRRGRLYKTGDLARYNEGGNLAFVGRKDTQVKIHGQRVELGEIEYHVQRLMPAAQQVKVEAITPLGENKSPILAAFSHFAGDTPVDQSSGSATARFLPSNEDIENRLAEHLPAYMIPTMFFTMSDIPMTTSGKTDRNRLREIVASISAKQLAELQTAERQKEKPPRTMAERELQALWAKVLNIDAANIGMDDNFFRFGGDSILAMKLVGEARRAGVRLSVAHIFKYPSIAQLASLEGVSMNEPSMDAPGELMLDPGFKAAFLSKIDLSETALHAEDISEIWPVTNFQEDFIVGGIAHQQFCNYYFLDLGVSLDLPRLKESCRLLLEKFSILRASFLPFDGKYWAVIPNQLDLPFSIHDADEDLQQTIQEICLLDMDTINYHRPPVAFVLIRNKSQGARLLIRLSHAQYDAMSGGTIFQTLMNFYTHKPSSQLPSFSTYLSHISHQRSTSISYWKSALRDSPPTSLAPKLLPAAIPSPLPIPIRIDAEIPLPKFPNTLTIASLISTAWALLLSHILSADEVTVGRLVSGRNASLPGVEEIVGPCVNIVPFRLRPCTHATTSALVLSVQEQFVALGEADSLGFKEIVGECTEWPKGAEICSVVLHQNVDEEVRFAFGDEGIETRVQRFENPRRIPYSLYVISFPRGERLGLQIFAHTHMISVEMARWLLDGLCRLIGELAVDVDWREPLSRISKGPE